MTCDNCKEDISKMRLKATFIVPRNKDNIRFLCNTCYLDDKVIERIRILVTVRKPLKEYEYED
jgi:hypothetical protein